MECLRSKNTSGRTGLAFVMEHGMRSHLSVDCLVQKSEEGLGARLGGFDEAVAMGMGWREWNDPKEI